MVKPFFFSNGVDALISNRTGFLFWWISFRHRFFDLVEDTWVLDGNSGIWLPGNPVVHLGSGVF